MKKMKKIIAVLLAAVLVLGMNLNVFADEPSTQALEGSITIENPGANIKYDAYLMFELESFDKTRGTYSYVLTEDWESFVEVNGSGAAYFEVKNGYVYLKTDPVTGNPISLGDTEKKELAELALAYAKDKKLTPTTSLPDQQEDGSVVYTKTGLPLGYYVVDSSMGALCSLTTADKVAIVTEKNTIPTVEKEVLEDKDQDGIIDDTDTWGESNNATIGDTVFFNTVIHAKPGAHNYVLHDRMGVGLTIIEEGQNAPKVMVGTSEVASENYVIKYHTACSSDSNIECDFEISFTDEYLETITVATDITVYYAAILNKDALIYTEANRNATYLGYGDDARTEFDYTYTYTYMFDVVKTNDANEILQGAKFELYKNSNDARGEQIKLKDMGNGSYHVATADEVAEGVDAVIVAGNVAIKGLDAGKYFLVETVAPTGYNKIKEDIAFEIESDNLKATFENGIFKDGGVNVINETGTVLPETGGMGTTLFYAVGGVLVVAAIVVFVTRKRMGAEE